ncbi:hypothetical protein [Psychroserpens algicola]|uniref:hypothetical protein n=1 Tax=Psychroserpens algicola TaxID=1719034 RepID=UPI001953AE2A|nr:hypothetical protein [Psychroserpens algicola]
MKTKNSKNGIRVAIGVIFGVLVGVFTSNLALWLPIGIAVGAGLEYTSQESQNNNSEH